MGFLIKNQLEIMLILGSFCGLMTVFCLIMDMRSKRKKYALVAVEIGTMILLLADRYAYIFRGNETELGYWMVRITNFLTFIMYYFILEAFNAYILELTDNGKEKKDSPLLLTYIRFIIGIGAVLVILSQFVGFYYSFDSHNRYQREPGFIICYVFPLLIILLQLKAIIEVRKKIRKIIYYSLLSFVMIPLVASILQIFAYGLSLTNISLGISAMILFLLALIDQNMVVVEINNIEISGLRATNTKVREQFEQTVLALASAIDAKDKYTHGHSRRVAEYSRRIARKAGKNEKYCEDIYFAALLHDVGKIGIPERILNKEGKLTQEEYEAIKEHPSLGFQILNEISIFPNLSIAACCHHERYDGRGYPNGLRGEEIPDLARIIAVADAYDAMTSSRSYRRPLAQQKVREELVKGLQKQFDPYYGRLMLHMLDVDIEYALKDDIYRYEGIRQEIVCDNDKEDFSEGIAVSDTITSISMSYRPIHDAADCVPSILVFDALDERVYTDERYKKEMEYSEFAEISFQGDFKAGMIRDYKVREYKRESTLDYQNEQITIETLKQRDHVLIRILFPDLVREYIIALEDRSRFVFVALTGKHCKISNISVHTDVKIVEDEYIPRIAEEISYIDAPEGDIPNMEIAGWREKYSPGIPLKNGLRLAFHTRSLPAARRIWHSPILVLFYSENGQVHGPGYREFAEIRFDGEVWGKDAACENEMFVSMNETFESWESWKRMNREGVESNIGIEISGKKVILEAEDHGLYMRDTAQFKEDIPKLYLAISGDQVALTNIHYL